MVTTEKLEQAFRILDAGMLRAEPGELCLAYSGGKDGIAVALLARQRGIIMGMCDWSWNFDQQRQDIHVTAELLGLKITYYDRFNLTYLKEHPTILFPQTAGPRNRVQQMRQRDSIVRYCKENYFKGYITGRKRPKNIVRSTIYAIKGLLSVHPLCFWSEQDVWDYLKDHGVKTP